MGGAQAGGLGAVEGCGGLHGTLRLLEGKRAKLITTVSLLERSLFVLYIFMFSSTNLREIHLAFHDKPSLSQQC